LRSARQLDKSLGYNRHRFLRSSLENERLGVGEVAEDKSTGQGRQESTELPYFAFLPGSNTSSANVSGTRVGCFCPGTT